MQNKAVAEQGLEEGEEEEQRGVEQVEDMGLGWMEACCRALDLHAAEPAVQVSRSSCTPGVHGTLLNSCAAPGGGELGHSQAAAARSRSGALWRGAGAEVGAGRPAPGEDRVSRLFHPHLRLLPGLRFTGS